MLVHLMCDDDAQMWIRRVDQNFFLRQKLYVCAISETNFKGKCEVVFGDVVGRVSSFVGWRAKEWVGGAATDLVVAEVCSGMEGGVIQAFVSEIKSLVLISAYGPGSEKSECVGSFGKNDTIVELED